jgi:hypothetical protein
VPATRARITLGRPDAIDQDGVEAVGFGFGWRTARPVAQPGIWFTAPGHGASKALKIRLANRAMGWAWNRAALLSVAGVDNPVANRGQDMKLNEVQQQAIQARMGLIVGAENYDRLFAGAVFDEVDDRVFYVFARTESLAEEIEEGFSHHLSTVAGQITGLQVDFVMVLPVQLR